MRIAGRITRRGARVNLLSVRAPRDSWVTVNCRGRDCPARSQTRRVSAAAQRPATQTMRFSSMRRHLRGGTVVDVSVTSDGAVGKFTRFVIRAGKAPLRSDLCIPPGASSPVRCS